MEVSCQLHVPAALPPGEGNEGKWRRFVIHHGQQRTSQRFDLSEVRKILFNLSTNNCTRIGTEISVSGRVLPCWETIPGKRKRKVATNGQGWPGTKTVQRVEVW